MVSAPSKDVYKRQVCITDSATAYAYILPLTSMLILFKDRSYMIRCAVTNEIVIVLSALLHVFLGLNPNVKMTDYYLQFSTLLLCYICYILSVDHLNESDGALVASIRDNLSRVVTTVGQVKGASNSIVDGVTVVRELADENRQGADSVVSSMEAVSYTHLGNQLVVLYGRTDSEKERLLGAFVQNKKHFYYRARQVAEREQRAQMGRELTARFEVMLQKYTYEEYFNRVKSGDPTKLVVVIDEFQYIAKKDPTFMEAVLKLKAHRLYPGPVMILLCSSAVSWAERELPECIGEAACRKIDRKIKFTNLNFLEVVRALPEYPVAECIKTYGIIGGVPGYINRWNAKADVKTNICRLILSPGGYLYLVSYTHLCMRLSSTRHSRST